MQVNYIYIHLIICLLWFIFLIKIEVTALGFFFFYIYIYHWTLLKHSVEGVGVNAVVRAVRKRRFLYDDMTAWPTTSPANETEKHKQQTRGLWVVSFVLQMPRCASSALRKSVFVLLPYLKCWGSLQLWNRIYSYSAARACFVLPPSKCAQRWQSTER